MEQKLLAEQAGLDAQVLEHGDRNRMLLLRQKN
jgi:hypothetical protein